MKVFKIKLLFFFFIILNPNIYGQEKLIQINNGNFQGFAVLNNDIIVYTSNDSLWSYNTTNKFTKLLKNIKANSIYKQGSYALFLNSNNLWVSDGTVNGTFILKENLIVTEFITSIGNTTYFLAGYINNDGLELWKTDGTILNTQLIKDIYPGPGSAFSQFNIYAWPYSNGFVIDKDILIVIIPGEQMVQMMEHIKLILLLVPGLMEKY